MYTITLHNMETLSLKNISYINDIEVNSHAMNIMFTILLLGFKI